MPNGTLAPSGKSAPLRTLEPAEDPSDVQSDTEEGAPRSPKKVRCSELPPWTERKAVPKAALPKPAKYEPPKSSKKPMTLARCERQLKAFQHSSRDPPSD